MGQVRRTTMVLTSVAVAAIGGGGLVDAFTAHTAAAAELPAFNSCGALSTWIDKAARQEAKHPMFAGGYGDVAGSVATGPMGASGAGGAHTTTGSAAAPGLPAPESATAARTPTGASSDAIGSSATGTNVQEVGVDEPDQVKTDGHYVVGVQTQGRGLWVAELAGHTPHVIGRLRLDGSPTSLLLAGHRALVIVSPQIAYPVGVPEPMRGGPITGGPTSGGPIVVGPAGGAADIAPIAPYNEQSRLEVIDLSDPHSPHVVAREDVTGSILTARQVGPVAWVVTQSQPQVRVHPGSSAPGVLPQRSIRDENGNVVAKGDALPCTAVRHPIALSGSQLLTVQPVDITASTPFTHGRSAGVVASGGFVYASAKRLYVATNAWGITASTQLHAFDISNNKSAAYVASGSVRGTLLSQWAMSEQDGYLRVATTSGSVVPPPGEGAVPLRSDRSQTSVVVLAERGRRLVQVGHVGGLGRGEKVWAVRFMGNLAAVVTFRQTDPLYLVDLSHPTAPRVRGALELTGYSSYLHPVGNGLLLGVGREADSVGHVLNAKATLFDVRDTSHPKRVSNLDLGAGWSDIDGDTHAFTYLPGQHVALLPLSGGGSAATSIKVDGSTLRAVGELTSVDLVQRFVPVGDHVVAMSGNKLLDVDPIALDVLGSTTLS